MSRAPTSWHIDVTVIKLLDGTRTYVHAVLDNFSQRILAWKLVLHLEPSTTCQLLCQAAKHLPAGSAGTSVVADSGVENVNEKVNALFESGPLRHVLDHVEVRFSNSMIETWWRSLKHGWLVLNQLDTFVVLEKLIAFYVNPHNMVPPHAAFMGQALDEICPGRGDQIPPDLAAGRARARAARLKSNRELPCEACRPPVTALPALPDPSAISGVLHVRDPMAGML